MGQLHEILAIEQDLKQKRKDLLGQIAGIISTPALFEGYRKKVEFFDEERKNEEKVEMQKVQMRVVDLIEGMKHGLSRWLDLRFQKEKSNQEAKADIIVGSETVLKDVPVTYLLSLEDELKDIIGIIKSIPILSKAIDWKKLTDDTYQSENPVDRPKTEKKWMHKVMYEATKEHPAQIKEWTEDRPCGRTLEDKWSGMIPEDERKKYVDRCEKLLYAVKKARQRANTLEVKPMEVGEGLMSYIFGNGS